MRKELHILGLLLPGPKTGYDLHRIVVAHGELFTDLKKGNVYYLLERMTQRGDLAVTTEAGARGPRRERFIYAITEQGRDRFHTLLRAVMRTYEVAHNGVEVGMVFVPYLDPRETVQLLGERRQAVLARRSVVEGETRAHAHLHEQLAQDHLMSLMDAELAWIERALQRLCERGDDQSATPDAGEIRCSGMRGDDPA